MQDIQLFVPLFLSADSKYEPLHALLAGGPGHLPQHSVEGSVAGHHRTSQLLQSRQHLGLVTLPTKLHVDHNAVHEGPRVTWHSLLQKQEVLDIYFFLENNMKEELKLIKKGTNFL